MNLKPCSSYVFFEQIKLIESVTKASLKNNRIELGLADTQVMLAGLNVVKRKASIRASEYRLAPSSLRRETFNESTDDSCTSCIDDSSLKRVYEDCPKVIDALASTGRNRSNVTFNILGPDFSHGLLVPINWGIYGEAEACTQSGGDCSLFSSSSAEALCWFLAERLILL